MSGSGQDMRGPEQGGLRRSSKTLVFGVSLVLVSPFIAASWIEKRTTGSEQVFVLLSQLLAILPGLPGVWLRGAFYFGTLDACSRETHIGFGSIFTHRSASVGQWTSLGSYCVIGHARLGQSVMIGSRVSVPSGKRQHLADDGRLSTEEGRYDTVPIGDGSWIGESAVVLAPVGQRCIVSAGAVVTRAIPDDCLVAGNPARIVRMLDTGEARSSEA
ncbi:MAG: acyltransferase [Burkholderiaceae bacterium]|nr:acyltransferase [Burkholderiaceae bacterium]